MTMTVRPHPELEFEPSTDFDFEPADFERYMPPARARRWRIIALLVIGAVIVGALGFVGGRAWAAPRTPPAPVPEYSVSR